MPRSPRDWKKLLFSYPQTVLGTRATLYVPRIVWEVRGQHFPQSHSENRGIKAQIAQYIKPNSYVSLNSWITQCKREPLN